MKPEVVLSNEFEVIDERAGDQSMPQREEIKQKPSQNRDIGHVASPKQSVGNSTVLMGSVVPKQPTVKPAAIGGLSKTIEKSKPKDVKNTNLEKTQPSKKTASAGVGMMAMPAKKSES